MQMGVMQRSLGLRGLHMSCKFEVVSKQLTSLAEEGAMVISSGHKRKTGPTAGVMVLLERGDMNASAAFSPAHFCRCPRFQGALSAGTYPDPGSLNF